MQKKNSLDVIRGGMLTSLQDLGRLGYQKYGVIVSGAMDSCALRLANLLVGNEEGEAALEITILGPVLQLKKNTLFAITGGDLSPTIDGKPVPLQRPVYTKADCRLSFGSCRQGCRAYLAVAGGFAIPAVMGSKSTYIRAGIGGFRGRALQSGDVLPIGEMAPEIEFFAAQLTADPAAAFAAPRWFAGWQPGLGEAGPIRVTRGSQFDWFNEAGQTKFFNETYEITVESDRMGYRLQGPLLERKIKREMISESLLWGTIQITNEGSPIILLADRQTAGGYPRIAQVAQVDLPRLAQLPAGSSLQFQEISLVEAEQLYLQREAYIGQMKAAIAFYRQKTKAACA